MSFQITNKNHRRLDDFLDLVLDSYARGEVELLTARGLLAHVMTAAAMDNESEFIAWLDPDQQQRWLTDGKRIKQSA